MGFPEFTDEEIYRVLICGEKPKGGYTIEEFVEEWNSRCEKGMNFQVDIPTLS